MAAPVSSQDPFSLAVFGPQSKQPTEEYLTQLRSFLIEKDELRPFVKVIKELSETWSLLAAHREDIATLKQGPEYLQILSNWMITGDVGTATTIMSSIFVLPLLTTIQIGQYFQFLELRGLRHHEFMRQVREGGGGIQGYCGGLLPAAAISCSQNEADVVENVSKALRLAVCIGAYAELGDDENELGPTSMVLRTKFDGQGEEIISKFPHVRIFTAFEMHGLHAY